MEFQEFQLIKNFDGMPQTWVAYGEFTSWEEYDVEHAPTEDMFDAIGEALEQRDPDLTIGGKSCEQLHYQQLFSSPLDACEFEAQCLSVDLHSLGENDKKFVLAGRNMELIPGYWNWLTSQVDPEAALLPEGRRGLPPRILVDNTKDYKIYRCDDGNGDVKIEATSPREAAEEFVADGDWGECSEPCLIQVNVQALNEEGEDIEGEDWDFSIPLNPPEPSCIEGKEHKWTSPESLGGCSQNPGVWATGNSFVYHELCAHCGVLKVTHTGEQCHETGQTFESVTYQEK